MTTSHTPGPYKLMTEATHFEILAQEGAITVAMAYRRDDAAFILRALESHDDLLAALHSLLFCLDSPSLQVQAAAALFQPAIAKARAAVAAVSP